MLSAFLKMLHLNKDETPWDKLQMEAARDRLSKRGEELTEASDELSKMIKRLRREEDK